MPHWLEMYLVITYSLVGIICGGVLSVGGIMFLIDRDNPYEEMPIPHVENNAEWVATIVGILLFSPILLVSGAVYILGTLVYLIGKGVFSFTKKVLPARSNLPKAIVK